MNCFLDSVAVRSFARSVLKSIRQTEWEALEGKAGDHFFKTLLPAVSLLSFADRHPILGLYQSLSGEVCTDKWARLLAKRGVRLAYPRVDPNSPGGLRYFLLPSEDPAICSWSRGAFGVREPHESWPEIAPDSMLAILVPGLAFGRRGERVGKGRGYYDRFLSTVSSPVRIGICPEQLLLDELPLRPWDQRMDIILTEAGVWDASAGEPLKSGVAPRRQLR